MEHNEISKARLWSGRIMSWLVILLILLDGTMKLIKPKEVIEATINLGYAEHHILVIGILALISIALYSIPRTAILGAVLLTGYLGGAVATHFRIDNPLFSHTLFPIYIGVLLWGGLWLRDKKLKSLFPLKH